MVFNNILFYRHGKISTGVNNAIGGYSTVLLNDNVYLIGGQHGNSKSNRLRYLI